VTYSATEAAVADFGAILVSRLYLYLYSKGAEPVCIKKLPTLKKQATEISQNA